MGYDTDIYVIDCKSKKVIKIDYETSTITEKSLKGRPIGLVASGVFPYVVLEPDFKDKSIFVETGYSLLQDFYCYIPNGDYRFTNHQLFVRTFEADQHIKFDFDTLELDHEVYFVKDRVGLINAFRWGCVFYTEMHVPMGPLQLMAIIEKRVRAICTIPTGFIRQIIPYRKGIVLLVIERSYHKETYIVGISVYDPQQIYGVLRVSTNEILSTSLYWCDCPVLSLFKKHLPLDTPRYFETSDDDCSQTDSYDDSEEDSESGSLSDDVTEEGDDVAQ